MLLWLQALRKEAEGRKAKQREQDRRYINKAALRAERMRSLSILQAADGDAQLPRIADGAASTRQPMLEQAPQPAASGAAVGIAAGDRGQQHMEGERTGQPAGMATAAATMEEGELINPRSCYVCKKRFKKVHHFYDLLCPACAVLNWEKRHQSADLGGMVALVTGGRVKIGYEVVLKLLRAGARVVVTTRFPHDCAARFARQADSPDWLGRLEVFGLDL